MQSPRVASYFGLVLIYAGSAGCFLDTGPGGEPTSGSSVSTAATSSSAGSTSPDSLSGTATSATTSATSATSTSATTTTATTTTSATATTSTASDVTITTTEPGATTTTTGTPGCKLLDDPCDSDQDCCGCMICGEGACTTLDDNCEACHLCKGDGACAPGPAGIPCFVPDPSCTSLVQGLVGDTCYAFLGAKGTCEADQTCTLSGCTDQGAAIAACKDTGCVRASNPCKPEKPAAAVTVETLCHSSGPGPGCLPSCINNVNDSKQTLRECGPGGACLVTNQYGCGAYRCDSDVCGSSCAEDFDCAPNFICSDTSCI